MFTQFKAAVKRKLFPTRKDLYMKLSLDHTQARARTRQAFDEMGAEGVRAIEQERDPDPKVKQTYQDALAQEEQVKATMEHAQVLTQAEEDEAGRKAAEKKRDQALAVVKRGQAAAKAFDFWLTKQGETVIKELVDSIGALQAIGDDNIRGMATGVSQRVKYVVSGKLAAFPGMRTGIEAKTILEYMPTTDLVKEKP